MASHVACSGKASSKPGRRLPSEKFLKESDAVTRRVNRVKRFVGKDSVIDLIFILASD